MNLNELRQDASATLRIPQHISLAPARVRRTYIAGPMTGYPDFNYPAFNAAAAQLRAAGIAAINPADHGVVPGAAWEDYLRSDLAQLATCESIYFLPGWSKSRGALLEHHVATSLGMTLLFAADAEKPEALRLRDELRERAEFEAWAQSIGTAIDADEHGNYLDGGLNYAKLGWQAALAATGKQHVGEVKEPVSKKAVREFIAARAPSGEYREDILSGDYDHTSWFDHIRELMEALAARQPVAREPVPPKKMERAVALDLLHAVYKHHGWRRAEGESMTARVHAIYDVTLDAGRNRFVATPKNAAPPAQAVDLGQPLHGILLIKIPARNRLDPIDAFVQDYEIGRGRIVVTCYGQAWCGFWGAMGDRTVMQFVASCNSDYVAGNMLSGRHEFTSDDERTYVVRIATEVITEFRALIDGQAVQS